MTSATLGFQIDSSQASSAAVDLDKLTAAATRTQGAADKLQAEVSGLDKALGAAAGGAAKVKPAVDGLGKTFEQQDEHVRAFRMEVERLTLKYQPLAQATRQYEATVSEIERAHKLGAISAQQMTQALDRERQAFERLRTSAASAGAAVNAANANGRPGANGNFATANVAAQFQDIAVTSAMGMNPLQIALQQGTQLSAVLGPMGATGAVKGLGAAFASVISPLSLVTIGLVAGTAAIIQYGYAWFEGGGDEIAGDLEKQADLLSSVAERWGDLVPSVKEYADELTRAREQADLLAGIDIVNQRKLEGTKSGLSVASVSVADLVNQLQSAGAETDVILDLQNAVNQFNKSAAEGTLKIGEVNSVQDALSAALRNTGIPAIADFRSEFEKLSDSALKSSKDVSESWREVAAALTSRFPSQGAYDGVERSADGRIMGEMYPYQSQTPSRRPNQESELPDPVTILNSDGRLVGVPIPGQKPNQFELEKEKDAVDDVTKAYRRAQEAQADFWLDLSFQERQATRSATDQKVAATLGRYGFDENLNSPAANAIRQQIQQGETKEVIKGFFSDIKSGAMENGGDIGKAIANAALNAATKAMDSAWDAIFDKLAGALGNWLTDGGKSGSPVDIAMSAGKATTTLGDFLGANDNKGMAAPVGAVSRAALGPVTGSGDALAWNFWKSKGLEDHQVAGVLGNIKAESAFNPAAIGDGGAARGLYQWNDRSPKMLASVGADWKNNPIAQHEFAYSELMGPESKAWGALKSAGNTREATAAFAGFERPRGFSWGNPEGAHNFSGRLEGAEQALVKFGGATEKVTQGVGKLGTGLDAIGQNFGAGAGLPGTAGGFNWSSLFSSSWKPNTTLGAFLGANANGTDYWRGGMSMVGERGPELLNLPQGSQVMSNHKLMGMMAANQNQAQAGIAGIRVFMDDDLKLHARVEKISEGKARQASTQALGAYSKQQTRGGFGDTQSVYASDKG